MEIKRNITDVLIKDLTERYSTILIGARQVGKTFLLHLIEREAQAQGLKTAFFDLEQPQVLSQFNQKDSEIIKIIASSGDVVIIDEFHYIKNASRIFKAIYDKGLRVKIYASGSSSLSIHKHLKESLAGRKLIYQIYPCSYQEIGQAIKTEEFDYYCTFGGLPGLVHYNDPAQKMAMLVDILQSYLLKDIKALIKEENIRAFNNLLYLLAQYQGSLVTTASLAREVGLTAKTIDFYLEVLAQTYVNFPLHSFSYNFGNELKKSKKYYLYDLGIRNTLLKNFSSLSERDDAGKIVESFVFLELHRKLSPETELKFWRLKSGEEVDFIWIKNQRAYPVEVKTSIGKGEVPDGIKAFIRRYPKTRRAFVLCRDYEGESQYSGTQISFKGWTAAASIPDNVD